MPAWLTSSDWIFYSSSAVFGLVAAWLLYRALFHDRSMGKSRCPKCWYDMSGAPAAVGGGNPGAGTDARWICPECGRVTIDARHFHRTRRYSARAGVGVLLAMLSYSSALTPQALKSGSIAFVPTTVLMFVAPAAPPPSPFAGQLFYNGKLLGPTATLGSRLSDAMWERIQRATAWDWQARWYLGRVLQSNRVELTELYRLPAIWPTGWPIPISGPAKAQQSAVPSAWGFSPGDFRIEVRNHLGAWESVSGGLITNACAPTLGKSFGFEARLTLAARGIAKPLVVDERFIEPTLRITRTIDEALTLIDDDASNESVRLALGPRLVRYADGMTLAVNDRLSNQAWTRINFIGCCKFKLLAGGTVLAEGEIPSWSSFPVWRDWQEKRIEWRPGAEAIVASGAAVQATFCGDAAASFRTYAKNPFIYPNNSAWSGTFTCPVVFAESAQPPAEDSGARNLNDR